MTPTPTRAERDEMRALLAKATPGPWGILPGDRWHDEYVVTEHPEYAPIEGKHFRHVVADFEEDISRHKPNGKNDAVLIVALRNRAEALLDELDRAEAENERIRAQRDMLRRDLNMTKTQAGKEIGRLERRVEKLTCKVENRDVRLETAEATIARLTAEVTER